MAMISDYDAFLQSRQQKDMPPVDHSEQNEEPQIAEGSNNDQQLPLADVSDAPEHASQADESAEQPDVHASYSAPDDVAQEYSEQVASAEGLQSIPSYIDSSLHSGLLNDEHESLIPENPGKGEEKASSAKSKMRLGEQLMSMGLISKDQLDTALQEQRRSKALLGQILTDLGFITESALAEILAESSGVERFDAQKTMIDPAVIKRIPKEVALRHKIIPVSLHHDNLKVVMADTYDVLALDAVRRYMDKGINIQVLHCTDTEVQDLANQYYDYEISVDGILREIETGIRDNDTSVLDGNQEGYVSPTVRLVNALLVDAVKQGASDLHFEPEGSFLRLRYRIDGQLMQVRTFHRDYWSAIAVRIKIMSGMNIAETRLPQDGRITFSALGREVDFRVATQPTVFGENIVMRLLDKSKSILPLEFLGFSDHNMTLLKKLLKRPEGIIVVTGPTGSGKTTTLYSILNYINSIDVNIMTLEDPVEYELPLIRQTNIKEGTMTFSSGIKSLMRQDPDIIFIGEIRDEETSLNAVRAALTGHQVFSTLHTNDALGIIPRLNDIGVPSHMLAGSLICGVAQRLARKLCSNCKTMRYATPEECKIMGVPDSDPPEIYEAVGCDACKQTGYKGRVALVEIMPVDKGMDELITVGATRNQMMEYLESKGFIQMIEDGISKVKSGDIDIKELISSVDVTERL